MPSTLYKLKINCKHGFLVISTFNGIFYLFAPINRQPTQSNPNFDFKDCRQLPDVVPSKKAQIVSPNKPCLEKLMKIPS